jgi:hypothetical protein
MEHIDRKQKLKAKTASKTKQINRKKINNKFFFQFHQSSVVFKVQQIRVIHILTVLVKALVVYLFQAVVAVVLVVVLVVFLLLIHLLLTPLSSFLLLHFNFLSIVLNSLL